jgi:endonuclease I
MTGMDVIKECSTSFPTSDLDSWTEMLHIFSQLECSYMKVKNEKNSLAIDDEDHALIIEI